MSGVRVGRVAFRIVASVVLLAAGGATTLLLTTPAVPHDLSVAPQITETPIGYQDFLDPRPVEVAFTRALDVSLSAPVTGQVTAYACQPAGTFVSGESDISIDGVPIVSIATDVPLWRDLQIGDTGDDVRALQAELQRLGFGVVSDGILGAASIDAVEQLIERASDDVVELTAVPKSQLIWIPSPTVATESCGLSLGGRVEAGSAVAVVAGPVATAHVVVLPKDVADGGRSLLVDDVLVTVSPTGAIEGAEAMAAFADAPSVRIAVATEGTTSVSGQYVLSNPIRVGVIPPSAIFALDGNVGCVLADSAPLKVRVVGSQLGQSSVVFPDTQSPRAVVIEPDSSRSCR